MLKAILALTLFAAIIAAGLYLFAAPIIAQVTAALP